jgi:hypothetical protein
MKQEILMKPKEHLNVAVLLAVLEAFTLSVPGCAIAFAHDLMSGYFANKRKAK